MVKAAERNCRKMKDPRPSLGSVQFLLSFPVLYPFPSYFLHFR